MAKSSGDGGLKQHEQEEDLGEKLVQGAGDESLNLVKLHHIDDNVTPRARISAREV